MTTRCKMMITFRYRNPAGMSGLSMQEKQNLWRRVNAQIFRRVPQDEASQLSRLAPNMGGEGGPPSMTGMASRIKTALNTANQRAPGNAEPFGDPMQVPGTETEYNIHDGVRCCGELFHVREESGDPWLVTVDGHVAEVMVKFNWERSLD